MSNTKTKPAPTTRPTRFEAVLMRAVRSEGTVTAASLRAAAKATRPAASLFACRGFHSHGPGHPWGADEGDRDPEASGLCGGCGEFVGHGRARLDCECVAEGRAEDAARWAEYRDAQVSLTAEQAYPDAAE